MTRSLSGDLRIVLAALALLLMAVQPGMALHNAGQPGFVICTGDGVITVDANGNEIPADHDFCPICQMGCVCCGPAVIHSGTPGAVEIARDLRDAGVEHPREQVLHRHGPSNRARAIRAPPIIL